jgi:inner membrane protein
MLGKQLGKRAIVLGAIAQSIPDIDIVASFWLDVPHDLLAHRGFTHSFLFVALLSPLFSFLSDRWFKNRDVSFNRWLFFYLVGISIHLLLDSLNAYGTGWLEPFSHTRFSFPTLFVADPFYTTWLVAVFAVLLFLHASSASRLRWAVGGLLLSSCYLVYAGVNKSIVVNDVDRMLHRQHVTYQRYFTTPTPLNTWLWMIVAEDSDGFYVGYRSVFDRKDSLVLQYFPRHDSLLAHSDRQEDIQQLQRFAQGYHTAVQRGDTLVFSDLRFGQRLGWEYPKANFVFEYYINFPDANKLAVQRGRFAGWNRERANAMITRIKGN